MRDQELVLEQYRKGLIPREAFVEEHEYGYALISVPCWECGEVCIVYPDETAMCKEHWTRYPRNWQVLSVE